MLFSKSWAGLHTELFFGGGLNVAYISALARVV